MRPVLLDADAFNCIRAMSFLRLLRAAPVGQTPMIMTEYVAHHELSDVRRDVDDLENEHRLEIRSVSRRKQDVEGQRFRQYRAEGMDKGESESLAWVMGVNASDRPLFISNDGNAIAGFRRHGVSAGHVIDLVVEAVESGVVVLDDARRVVSIAWDERPDNQCRPRDYTDFDETYARRLANSP